jgi:adenylate cyclase
MVAKKRRMMRLGNLRAQRRYAGQVRDSIKAAGGTVGEEVPIPGLPDVGSQIAIPLMVKDRLIGVFAVESPQDNAFDALDEVILKIVSNQVATAIDNANAYAHQAVLTEAYSRFVPREFLAHLNKESIVSVKLGDQVQGTMTVLFADIRSFTTLSESMSPADTFAFLNSYLGMVAPVIRSCNGFIDKYIGDAIMAIFPGSPADAMRATTAMHGRLELYNETRKAKGRAPIRIGIGLHMGSLMLGVIGFTDRMEGTVISDSVNLASRIEGLTGPYGARVLVSAQVLAGGLPEGLRSRFVDSVKVKGKNEPVSLHELLDPALPDAARKVATIEAFAAAVEHYQNQRFAQALEAFQGVSAQDPEDRAARLYVDRCRQLLERGVPEGWSPVTKLDSK